MLKNQIRVVKNRLGDRSRGDKAGEVLGNAGGSLCRGRLTRNRIGVPDNVVGVISTDGKTGAPLKGVAVPRPRWSSRGE